MRWSNLARLTLLATAAAPAGQVAHAQNGPAGPIELSQAWTTPGPVGGDTSVMFILHNAGPVPEVLIRAACAEAEAAELVGPSANGGAQGQLPQLGLAPGQTLALTPDSTRLVLHHLHAPVQLGQTLHCTATFARTGERLFETEVRQAAPPPAPPL